MPKLTCVLDGLLKGLAAVALAALTLCVMAGVVSRGLNDPLAWTDELSRFLMVWVAILGWLLASRRRAHIRIRFFHDFLPPFWWSLAEIVMQLAVALFGLLIAWLGIELVRRNADIEATSVPLTLMWFYVPLVAAGLIAALQAVADIADAYQRRSGLPVSPAPVGEAERRG